MRKCKESGERLGYDKLQKQMHDRRLIVLKTVIVSTIIRRLKRVLVT